MNITKPKRRHEKLYIGFGLFFVFSIILMIVSPEKYENVESIPQSIVMFLIIAALLFYRYVKNKKWNVEVLPIREREFEAAKQEFEKKLEEQRRLEAERAKAEAEKAKAEALLAAEKAKYELEKEKLSKVVSAICPSCGASSRVVKGETGTCPYCKSAIHVE